MHVTFAPPSSACVLVSISQPPNLYGFYMIVAFDLRRSPLGGYAAKCKACAKSPFLQAWGLEPSTSALIPNVASGPKWLTGWMSDKQIVLYLCMLQRHRVSWGSPLLVPLRVHMLSIDYQNYQIQKIKVINKTGHPAYWTRHKETLNCQPT